MIQSGVEVDNQRVSSAGMETSLLLAAIVGQHLAQTIKWLYFGFIAGLTGL